MGTIAQQTAGRQMVALTPKQNLQRMLRDSWPRIASVVGNNVSPDRLYQMCVSAINKTPKLAECTPQSVLSCFMTCSALGLEPSNVDGLGRAYVLPFYNGRTHRTEATFIMGYRGMIDLARRSGQLVDISARAVHEGDEFSYSYGLNEDLRHVPCASPGELTHVYMVAHFKDGGHYFLVLNRSEIEQAKARSKSGNFGPWKTDFEAMAKKTAIRRAAPYLPLTVQAQTAVAADGMTPDYGDVFQPVLDDEPGDAGDVDVESVEADMPDIEAEVEVDVKEAE